MTRTTAHGFLVASTALAIALGVWGSIGWRRAYRAQAEAERVALDERVRDAQLLRIVVSGGEAAAQMAIDAARGPGATDCVPPSIGSGLFGDPR